METTFYEKAKPLVALGLPVIPLVPGDKCPPSNMKGWQKDRKFSTDLAVIAAWNQENPEYNVAMVAMAEDDGFCFLEFDAKPGLKTICAEFGRDYPDTRIHRSGKGGGHYIFKHTPETMALGNRQACLPDGREWFSFRADRKFLVGAGSLHPNGRLYEVVRDNPPLEMPDWLAAWVEENSKSEHVPKKGETQSVADDFDFDHWCDHYSEIFTIQDAHEEGWMTTDVCPWSGHRHQQSFMTGFYYDGETLGFHCFAGGCEGYDQGIGATIKMMNEKIGPYPYLVWEEENHDGKWSIEDVEVDVSPQSRIVTREELFDEAPILIAAAPAVPVVTSAKAPVATIVAEKPVDPLKMPDDALYGALGQMAYDMKMPLGLAYPALLTCYSAKIIHDEMDNCRLNLYTCLIASKGGGKDQARHRALAMLDMRENNDYLVAVPASDRGIQVLFGDQPPLKRGEPRVSGPRRMLLVTEEIEEILKKGSIDKSGMFQTFCTLWDGNTKTFADRTGKSTVNCRLSWLGGIPLNADSAEKFSEIWGETSTHGLLSRFLLGYSGVKWNYRKWSPPPIKHCEQEIDLDGESVALTPEDWHPPTLVEKMSPEAEAFYGAWESTDESGRDKYHLHKVALLTASANDEKIVSLACMEAAARFMAWQARLHEVFKPGIAANYIEAKASERILDTLRRKDARGETNPDGYIAWRRVSHDNKWTSAFGANLVARVISGLIDCGELKPLVDESEDGKKEKVNKNYVRVTKANGEKSPMGNVVPPKAV